MGAAAVRGRGAARMPLLCAELETGGKDFGVNRVNFHDSGNYKKQIRAFDFRSDSPNTNSRGTVGQIVNQRKALFFSGAF